MILNWSLSLIHRWTHPQRLANIWYWQSLDIYYPTLLERLYRRIRDGKHWERQWLDDVHHYMKL